MGSEPAHTPASAEAFAAMVSAVLRDLRPTGAPLPAVHPSSRLDRDLGLDSLSRVELISRIEMETGITLPEQAFAEAGTVEELYRFVTHSTVAAPARAGMADAGAPPMPQVSSPDTATTLVDVLRWHVTEHGDRPHLVLYRDEPSDQVISYKELWRSASAVAARLQGHGLEPQQTVALMLPTGRDYFVAFFGVLLAGGVPVSLYPPAKLSQLSDHLVRHRQILTNCGARVLIAPPEAARYAKWVRTQVETLHRVLTPTELTATDGATTSAREPGLLAEHTAFIQYTSGSTGNPKGVVLSHGNLLANIRAMGERVQASSDDVFVSWLPLYHDMGLIGAWLGSLYYASRLVVMSPLAFISRPSRWLHAIHRYGGTLSAAPNFAFELCVRRIADAELDGVDLSTWRAAFNGAEAVNPATIERFVERFGPYGFRPQAMMPVYGLAESCVGLCFPPLGRGPRIDSVARDAFMHRGRAEPAGPTDPEPLRFVACGSALPRHHVRVVDRDGQEVADRQQGQIQFQGPSATSGYYRNPQASQQLFDHGWLNSGDLGYMDDGELFVTGRIKDMIIRSGRNVYPQEIEEAVGDLPYIRKGRVAVFGSRAPDTGTERLVVMAETRDRDSAEQAGINQRINAIVMQLTGEPADDVVLADPGTVLKTSSGKIRRDASRQLYERGTWAARQAPMWWQVAQVAAQSAAGSLRRSLRRLYRWGYGVYAWVVFALLALWVVTATSVVRGLEPRWRIASRSARRLLQWTGIPLHVQGQEHLPPPGSPLVLVANHASYLDAIVLMAVLDRPVSFVAKSELARHWLTRLPLKRLDTRFVERFELQQSTAAARELAEQLRQGSSLMFFPEGTFRAAPGLLPFRMGAFLAAAQTGTPVIPIALRGTRAVLGGEHKLASRRPVTVTVGEPIPVDPAHGSQAWEEARHLNDSARQLILRYAGEPDAA